MNQCDIQQERDHIIRYSCRSIFSLCPSVWKIGTCEILIFCAVEDLIEDSSCCPHAAQLGSLRCWGSRTACWWVRRRKTHLTSLSFEPHKTWPKNGSTLWYIYKRTPAHPIHLMSIYENSMRILWVTCCYPIWMARGVMPGERSFRGLKLWSNLMRIASESSGMSWMYCDSYTETPGNSSPSWSLVHNQSSSMLITPIDGTNSWVAHRHRSRRHPQPSHCLSHFGNCWHSTTIRA